MFSAIRKQIMATAVNTRNKCVFCKIYAGEEKSEVLYKDDDLIVFPDIKPRAKHHYLIVSKEHIPDAKILTKDHLELLNKLINKGKEILQERSADLNDARYGFHWPPFNTINHLHLHVLSPVSEMSFLGRVMFRENSMWFVTADYVVDRISKM